MKSAGRNILTINGGSSSIRFAVYEAGETLRRRLDGKIDRIGLSGTNWIVHDPAGKRRVPRRLAAANHRAAVAFLLDWIEAQPIFASIKAIGHRVVHGMKHSKPERVTPKLLAELHRITAYAAEHLPREIELIEAFRKRCPNLPHVACFEHPHGLSDEEFDALFTKDKPVIFAFHGYPSLIHQLTYRRTNHDNVHVRGYKEEGTITTPFDMTVLNDLDRFHLVMDTIDRLPQTGEKGISLKQQFSDKLIEHRQYINKYGGDLPEIRNWKWEPTR